METFETIGREHGEMLIKPARKDINTLIEMSEQSEKYPEEIRAEVRAYLRVAIALNIKVKHTTLFSPEELALEL